MLSEYSLLNWVYIVEYNADWNSDITNEMIQELKGESHLPQPLLDCCMIYTALVMIWKKNKCHKINLIWTKSNYLHDCVKASQWCIFNVRSGSLKLAMAFNSKLKLLHKFLCIQLLSSACIIILFQKQNQKVHVWKF